MLDAKALDVLNSLKAEIKATKPILTGTVKGTGKNFGFVVCTSGEEYFLAPEEMSRVFPGDEVTFTIETLADGKTRAILESLIASQLQSFIGTYVVRGKAQGIEPFDTSFNSWLFVPPSQTAGLKHNQIVKGAVARHPWKTGKAQGKIEAVLGDADDNRTWYKMALLDNNIPSEFSEAELMEAQKQAQSPNLQGLDYQDLTALDFVTIDSASTRDMDDALYCEVDEQGWTLFVAIADASAYVAKGSAVDQAARQRLSTCYLPGLTLPMVPECLAHEAMSLTPDTPHLAMVFALKVSSGGQASLDHIVMANIQSQGKLSYEEVSAWLDNSEVPETREYLVPLHECAKALSRWRETNANAMPDRPDYRIRVDEHFNVTGIDKELRNTARTIVEECMIATNSQTAQWLNREKALFMTHPGFKSERDSELKGLLRDYASDVSELDAHSLENFLQIMKAARKIHDFPLQTVLTKRFERGSWQANVQPHFGLGLPAYTTVTSPIRKYSDLALHRFIKARLLDRNEEIEDQLISDLNSRGNLPRQTAAVIEKRLGLQWLAKQPAQQWKATVIHMNANGLIVQLDDNGLTGFIDLRKQKDSYSYDALRMLLKFEHKHYQLGDALKVSVSKIDEQQALFTLQDL